MNNIKTNESVVECNVDINKSNIKTNESVVECNVNISKFDIRIQKALSIIKSDVELLAQKTFNEFILKIMQKIRYRTKYMEVNMKNINVIINKIGVSYDVPLKPLYIIFINCYPDWQENNKNENNRNNVLEWNHYVYSFIDIYKRTFCLSEQFKDNFNIENTGKMTINNAIFDHRCYYDSKQNVKSIEFYCIIELDELYKFNIDNTMLRL
jgi:hypothetical protein